MLKACIASLFLLAKGTVDPIRDIEPHYSVKFPDRLLSVPIDGLPMTLENGEQYVCELPSSQKPVQSDVTSEPDDRLAIRTQHASKALFNALNKHCFIRISGWWIYEFCYGRSLRQYHRDEKKGLETEFRLGHAAGYHPGPSLAGQGAAGESAPEKKEKPTLPPGSEDSLTFRQDSTGPHYYARYSNGTACDVTGKPRETEVRYYCTSTSPYPNNHFFIEEVETCTYSLSLYTDLLCSFEDFLPPQKRTDEITCHRLPSPVLEGSALVRTTVVKAQEEGMQTSSTAAQVPTPEVPSEGAGECNTEKGEALRQKHDAWSLRVKVPTPEIPSEGAGECNAEKGEASRQKHDAWSLRVKAPKQDATSAPAAPTRDAEQGEAARPLREAPAQDFVRAAQAANVAERAEAAPPVRKVSRIIYAPASKAPTRDAEKGEAARPLPEAVKQDSPSASKAKEDAETKENS